MKPVFTLKVPTAGFTFKPVVAKPKRISNSHKPLTRILYCVAKKTENGWEAHINTKGLEGYEEITIIPFTERSFELKGVNDVFYHKKDEKNHWVRIIRTDIEATSNPGNPQTYCTLCDNCIFSGHIVKIEGKFQFDMSVYQGTFKQCENLMTMVNKTKKEDEE